MVATCLTPNRNSSVLTIQTATSSEDGPEASSTPELLHPIISITNSLALRRKDIYTCALYQQQLDSSIDPRGSYPPYSHRVPRCPEVLQLITNTTTAACLQLYGRHHVR